MMVFWRIGLPLRTAHPTVPVRSTTVLFTFTFGSTGAHMFATRSSTRITWKSPRLSISIMSSSSSASGTGDDVDGRLAGLLEPLVEREEVLVVDRRGARVHRLPGQIVHRVDDGRRRPREDHYLHRRGVGRRHEVDDLLALLGHPHVDGDVAETIGHAGDELVARGRDDQEREGAIAELLAQRRVQVLLDDADQVRGVAALAARVR